MKKYYYLLIATLLTAMTVSLTACGDDEPSSSLEKQLIGEWNDGPSSMEVFYLKLTPITQASFGLLSTIWVESLTARLTLNGQ